MLERTDIELVYAAQCGDWDAFAHLYHRHAPKLFRTIYALTQDRGVAEDLLQETFVRVYQHLHRVNGQVDSLAPWLHRIAVNLTYNWLTRRRFPVPSLEEVKHRLHAALAHTPDEVIAREERRQAVREALAALDEKHRVVVVLYYIQEFSVSEIADILDVPVGTVKSRLHYARKHLERMLATDERIRSELILAVS
ncbi:MAG: sigma-70 family RNA polymerase sigma factor [Ardenticatenia bacterium]|nr:sigma-70 family RNA polymerase sigma factor [Ardenticatenia bacterium]